LHAQCDLHLHFHTIISNQVKTFDPIILLSWPDDSRSHPDYVSLKWFDITGVFQSTGLRLHRHVVSIQLLGGGSPWRHSKPNTLPQNAPPSTWIFHIGHDRVPRQALKVSQLANLNGVLLAAKLICDVAILCAGDHYSVPAVESFEALG
jgi:hypothetical protein